MPDRGLKYLNLLRIALRTFPKINTISISYCCVFKRSSEPVMKGSRVESIEEARNEYKKLLEEGWEKTYRFNSFFLKKW